MSVHYHQAKCDCGWRSPLYKTKKAAVRAAERHLDGSHSRELGCYLDTLTVSKYKEDMWQSCL